MKRLSISRVLPVYAGLLAGMLPLSLVTTTTQWMGLAGCGLLVLLNLREVKTQDWLSWLSLALLGWWLLSAACSGRPLHALQATLQWALPFFAFYLYLRGQVDSRRALRQVLAVSGLSYLALLAYAFLLSAFPGKAAIRPFFLDANFFAAALSLVLPGLWALGLDRSGPRWPRIAALAASALVLAAVLALRSRGAWVGLGGGALLLVFLRLDRWWQRGLFLALGLGLGWLTTGVLRQYLEERPPLRPEIEYLLSTTDTQTDFSNRERLMRWRCAWRMFGDDPVLGRGPGTYAPDFKHYLRDGQEVQQISYWWGWTGGGHSTWLTALAETGLCGLLLLLAWCGIFLGRAVPRLRAGPDRWWMAMAILAVGTWMVHGVFNDLLMLSPVAGLLGIWFGMVEE